MIQHSRTKLVPLEVRHEEQSLETGELSQLEQPKSELDIELECPRCSEIMELCSSFDKLMYTCESCNFLLKCV
jgi:phage FluMu protein Com